MNQYRIIERRLNYDEHKSNPPKDPNALWTWEREVARMVAQTSQYDSLIIRRPTDSFVIIDMKPDKPWFEAYDINGNKVDDIRSPEVVAADEREQALMNEIPDWLRVPSTPRDKINPNKPLNLLDGDEE